MVSILSELELCSIDRMTRQELIAAVRVREEDLPVDLLGNLEEQATDRLQLLLLAGRLIQVLRYFWEDTAGTPSPCGRRSGA
jgi:hypothetical protein